nr:uncharacterized protein LOC111428798 [Onthophagus taurus]
MDLSGMLNQMSLKNEEEPFGESNIKISKEIIDEIQTDIAYCEFTNQLFLIITQFGKAGSCLKIAKERLETDIGVEFVYKVDQIFGDITIEQETTARYLAQYLDIKKPLLIFVNLTKYNKETVKEIGCCIKKVIS